MAGSWPTGLYYFAFHGPRRGRLQVDQQKRQKKRARVALESHEKCQRHDLPGVSLSTGVML